MTEEKLIADFMNNEGRVKSEIRPVRWGIFINSGVLGPAGECLRNRNYVEILNVNPRGLVPCKLSQFRFGHELVERGIARHYGEEDIAEDLAYAGGQ